MLGSTIGFFFLGLLLLVLSLLNYNYNVINQGSHDTHGLGEKDSTGNTQGFIYLGIALTIICIFALAYIVLEGTIYKGHLKEWLNILVRVIHITFGIAWIGASFYFVFLENSLNRTENLRDELAGNLWAVHGGGFYYLEKYKLAPKQLPRHLHWFKYEAYFTWLSGFCLLCVVYYFNAESFLIDPNVLDISPVAAVCLSIWSLAMGWFIYDFLCETPLKNNIPLFSVIGFIIVVGFAYFYSQVFSGRAAYIHFGAMLGTIMAGNVFFVIIPGQKKMVECAKKGLPVNPVWGKNAGFRSLHNNYFTLPVLFVMVSNHFPSTFGNEHNWIILAGITVGTAGIKHYLNLREKGQLSIWILPVSCAILLAVAFATAPKAVGGECKDEVTMDTIYPIIVERCTTCHSSNPTDDVWTAPPNGVVYDTPADIARLSEKIMDRVVITKTMPQNNKTGITAAERDLIRCWIEQGAKE